MTPQERTEKILEGMPNLPVYREKMVKTIAAQIEEADKEGYERARVDLGAIHVAKWKNEDYAEGFRAAREKAKGIILETRLNPLQQPIVDYVAQRIAEMEPEK